LLNIFSTILKGGLKPPLHGKFETHRLRRFRQPNLRTFRSMRIVAEKILVRTQNPIFNNRGKGMFKTIEWKKDRIVLLDQSKLPEKEVYVECREVSELADCIRKMVIRGAPAIGVAAAMGIALGAGKIRTKDREKFRGEFERICKIISATRPTAVNLFWSIDRMKKVVDMYAGMGIEVVKERLTKEALKIYREDIEINRQMGKQGRVLIRDGARILTHCNAGALATAGYGTALGVIRAAKEEGKKIGVFVCETRPVLQGARLTAWELKKSRVKVTVLTDGAAAFLMQRKMVDLVITGADRIAANGDSANKIGTYALALSAKAHNLPFYIAAPLSTIDVRIRSGREIPIELRSEEEVTHIQEKRFVPQGIKAWNPAFDVTPAEYITAIITEKGIVKKPYLRSIHRIFS
jgi:methylthioribose-1-phosphate isomerase